MRATGVPCEVINLTRYREQREAGVHVPSNALAVMRLLFSRRARVVHLHFGGTLSPRLLGLCLFASLLPGRRVVLTFHSGGYPTSRAGMALRPSSPAAFILRRLDALIGVNEALSAYFRGLGAKPERVHTVVPFALAEQPAPGPLPEPLGRFFASASHRIFSASGFEPEYDIPSQFQAMEAILARFPRAALAIAGCGRREAELHAAAAKLPWKDRVLLCGDVPHASVLTAMREADVCLRTTLYDGDAISVREALAMGTPVIATDNKMRPPGVTLVPIGDSNALAAAVIGQLERGRVAGVPGDEGQENLHAIAAIYRHLLGGEWPALSAQSADNA
jgi:glycogen(starch) synthase